MAHRRHGTQAGTGRDASEAKADRKPERLRLLPARYGRLARLDQGRSRRGAKPVYRAIELDPTLARPHALAAGCYLMRGTVWVVDRATETAETWLARLGAALGRADAVAARLERTRACSRRRRHQGRDRSDRSCLAIEPEPCGCLAAQRLDPRLCRRTRGGDRARPIRPQPIGSADAASRTQRHCYSYYFLETSISLPLGPTVRCRCGLASCTACLGDEPCPCGS